MCKELNIEVITRASHTLYHPQKYLPLLHFKLRALHLIFMSYSYRIIEKNGGKAPLTYRQVNYKTD